MRTLRAPLTGKRLRAAAVVLAGVLTLSGCGFKGLYTAPLPGGADLGNHPYSLTIQFADVLDLVPQSAVKVNDVAVGKVTGISLGQDDHTHKWFAKVTVKVQGSVNLPSNARAEVEQTSLLGEKYVALVAPPDGKAAATRLRDGTLIKEADTTSAPEVEQVLGALSLLLNDGGLAQIQNIARELNVALGTPQRKQAARDLIKQLSDFTGTLDNQKNEITTALDSIDTLARTLNRQKTVITDALDNFPQALHVLSQERGKLVTLLTSLSNLGSVATRVINTTEEGLVSSLKALDPVVTRLAAAGAAFPKSLKILGTIPFPLGITRQLVKGDYANLDAVLNFNLADELCGILGIKSNILGCGTTAADDAVRSKLTGRSSSSVSSLPPMLVGAAGG